MRTNIENKPVFLVVDLFCGAGGTTQGFVQTNGVSEVIACVNHDPMAIKSHWANHPEVKHYEEDILTLDLTELGHLVENKRAEFPNAKVILWASLECTNFSKAKGGQPRDADSRTLAWGLPRYIEALNPEYVMIENVVEFMAWGPLDENNKPVSKHKGEDWLKWRDFICTEFGYQDEWQQLNSANFGAYTSRNRLFGIFAKDGLPIRYPKPTHSKNTNDNLKQWKPVREVLDFEDEGISIFNRKIPLVDASLERIYAGLIKFVAGGKENFILKYNSRDQKGNHHVPGVDIPCPTIACQNRLGIIKACFLSKYYSGNPEEKVKSIESPTGVITCIDHHSLVQTVFLTKYYSTGVNIASVEMPANTITTKDRIAKVCTNKFILNPSHGGHTQSIDNPSPVVVARQDKAPLYLITATEGLYQIPIYACDSAIMIKIKEFMAMYGVCDIKMRMLKVMELLMIQGFPKEYKLLGNQSQQKKFIGNSVVPQVVAAWVISLADALNSCDSPVETFIEYNQIKTL